MNAGLQPIRARLLEQADTEDALHQLARGICTVFGAERATVFVLSEDAKLLRAMLQCGLEDRPLVQISSLADSSVAGFALDQARTVNLADAHDASARAAIAPGLKLLSEVDERTGFRTRELLTVPIPDTDGGDAIGVLQLLNSVDRKPFSPECESAATALCETLAVAIKRRLRSVAGLRGELAQLKAQAEDGLREDSPGPAAQARESLLQMLRSRFLTRGHFDLEWNAPRRAVGWGARDFEGLEWICRLARAGHSGADRLLDRVFVLRSNSQNIPASPALHALAGANPRVAVFLAAVGLEAGSPDLEPVAALLDQGGPQHVEIAKLIRELYRAPTRTELGILQSHVVDAAAREPWRLERKGGRTAALLADIGERRLSVDSGERQQAALALLDRAARLGSFAAYEEAWVHRYGTANDKAAWLREWLATDPPPAKQSSRQCRMVGMALELGEAGGPPDPQAALKWYLSGISSRPAPGSDAPALDGPACWAVGHAFEDKWSVSARAMAWHRRGAELGYAPCFLAWLSVCAQRDPGKGPGPLELEAFARQFMAGGAKLDRAALRPVGEQLMRCAQRHREGAHADQGSASAWMRLADLIGYRPDDEVDKTLELARAYLEMGDKEGARELVAEIQRLGDEWQRDSARQILEQLGNS